MVGSVSVCTHAYHPPTPTHTHPHPHPHTHTPTHTHTHTGESNEMNARQHLMGLCGLLVLHFHLYHNPDRRLAKQVWDLHKKVLPQSRQKTSQTSLGPPQESTYVSNFRGENFANRWMIRFSWRNFRRLLTGALKGCHIPKFRGRNFHK